MTIEEMHFDFQKKFNKIDSNQNRNLIVQEIDWTLNEAQERFIKTTAIPNKKSYKGYSLSERDLNNIRPLIVTQRTLDKVGTSYSFPSNYWYHIEGKVMSIRNSCSEILSIHFRDNDRRYLQSPFDRSSFKWRTVNAVIDNTGIRFDENDIDFDITAVLLTYLRRPSLLHNAASLPGGTYRSPSGRLLSGKGNCELPEQTHREIVDLAVLIASSEITNDYNIKKDKESLNV